MRLFSLLVKTASFIFFYPILLPISYCPDKLPWVWCGSCSLFWCPGKWLSKPILFLILGTALLSNRIFCRFLCPFGTISDCISSISNRVVRSPQERLFYRPWVKWLFLVVVLWAAFGLSTPEFTTSDWAPYLFGIFIFLSAFNNRYWCRLACPIGTIILLLNKISHFSIKMKKICSSSKFIVN